MDSKYKFHNAEGSYFVSFAVRNWADVFIVDEYKNILIENIIHCQKLCGLEIYAWCIMNSHMHLIVKSKEGYLLKDVLQDLKSKTGKSVIGAILKNPEEIRKEWLMAQFKTGSGYRFWKKGSHPIEIVNKTQMEHILKFIHHNPVTEGLVFSPEEYEYSSAVDFAGGKGLLNIKLKELQLHV